MSEWVFVNVAYALTWAALALYALSLRHRRRRVEAEAQVVRTEGRQS